MSDIIPSERGDLLTPFQVAESIDENTKFTFELFNLLFPQGLNGSQICKLSELRSGNLTPWKKFGYISVDTSIVNDKSRNYYNTFNIYKILYISIVTDFSKDFKALDAVNQFQTWISNQQLPFEEDSDLKPEAIRRIKAYFGISKDKPLS